jgi:glutathione S-transferase
MYDLYIANKNYSSWSLRPWVLMRELRIKFNERLTPFREERHAGVWPAARSARAWARCAAAEMHSGFGALRERCTMNCGIRVRLSDMPAVLRLDIERLDELWNEGFRRFGGPFLAGESFSAADAFFAPVAFRIQTYGLTLGEAGGAYAKRLLALPSMRSWEQEALREPWREPGHEAEARATGTWVQDLRTGSDS